MDDEEDYNSQPPRNFRQRLSMKIGAWSDGMDGIRTRIYHFESGCFHRLPLPSRAVRWFQNLLVRISFAVDDICPECQCSPGHSRECSKYCPVKYVMES